jgi:hypothetical protein
MVNSPFNGPPRNEAFAASIQQLGLVGCVAALTAAISLVIVGSDIASAVVMPLFLLLTTIVSRRFGLKVGLFTIVLSCLALAYFFQRPIFRPWADEVDQQVALAVFFVSAIVAGFMVSGGFTQPSAGFTSSPAPGLVAEAGGNAAQTAAVRNLRVPPLLVLDADKRRIYKDGEEVVLTPKEFNLLVLLARSPGRLVTHDTIVEQIWGPNFENGQFVLRTYIKQLRAKLDDSASRPSFIRTEHRMGYRFVGDCLISET